MPSPRPLAWLTTAIAVAVLVPAGAASADDDLRAAFDRQAALPDVTTIAHGSDSGGSTGAPPATGSGQIGQTVGADAPQTIPGSATPTPAATPAPQPAGANQATPPAAPHKAVLPKRRGKTGTTCTRTRRSRVCLTYRDGVLRKRCVTKRGHRARCTRPKPGVARAAALNWQGYLGSSAMKQVGQIQGDATGGRYTCTGTIVGRSLVLTAGHCVWDAKHGVAYSNLFFVPGMAQSGSSYSTPNSVWKAGRSWVPNGYKSSTDQSLDYALVEIAPVDGRQIGDVLGSFSVTYGGGWTASRRVYSVGYPSSGWFAAEGRNGRSQYACDTTFRDYVAIGSGYRLWSQCTMNRGASGGPWFVQDDAGRWTVQGVNSTCEGFYIDAEHYCDPYSTGMSSSFFDSRVQTFWNSVAAIRGTNS